MGMIRETTKCPQCGAKAISLTDIYKKNKTIKCFSCKFNKKYVSVITWKEKSD